MATATWLPNAQAQTPGIYQPHQQQPQGFVPGNARDDELFMPPAPSGTVQYGYAPPMTWGQGGAPSPAQQSYQPPAGGGQQPGGGGLLTPGSNAAYGTPLPGTTLGPSALSNTGPAADETTTAGLQSQTRDALINILDQGIPTANDPVLAPQISAFNAAQQRAAARKMAANSEAFGAQGLESSGAALSANQGVLDNQALAEGGFASGLVGAELTARRNQIMDALKVAQATTDSDLSRRLQEELANIDAAIRNRSLDVQTTLGQGDIDLRRDLGTGNLNLGLLGLLTQDRQFGDRLGVDVAQIEAALNNAALRAAIGL